MTTLAQRLRLYGVGMIHFKLRQAGKLVNYRDAERLHRLEQRHVSQRRRKKIPLSDSQSPIRRGAANEIWLVDFVFARVAPGRTTNPW